MHVSNVYTLEEMNNKAHVCRRTTRAYSANAEFLRNASRLSKRHCSSVCFKIGDKSSSRRQHRGRPPPRLWEDRQTRRSGARWHTCAGSLGAWGKSGQWKSARVDGVGRLCKCNEKVLGSVGHHARASDGIAMS